MKNIKIEGKTSDFEPVSNNKHTIICVGMYDIGMQAGLYKATESDRYITAEGMQVRHKIVAIFEVSEKVEEGKLAGKNKLLYHYFTLSTHEKSGLAKFYKRLTGKDLKEVTYAAGGNLPIEDIVGTPFDAFVTHNERQNGGVSARISMDTVAPHKGKAFTPMHDYAYGEESQLINRLIARQIPQEEVLENEAYQYKPNKEEAKG